MTQADLIHKLNTSEATDEIPHYLRLNKGRFLSLTNQRDVLLNHIQDAKTVSIDTEKIFYHNNDIS